MRPGSPVYSPPHSRLGRPTFIHGGDMNTPLGRAVVVFFLVFLSFASSAVAQQGTAEIRGKVTDQQAGSLPGVTVTVTNQESGNFREAVSSSDGSYFMAALPPGRYQVTAQLQGFKKFVR